MMKGLELPKESLVKVENAITEAIVRVVEMSNTDGAVIALSGGIDSAVVATLAARAVDVYALLLPDRASTLPVDMKHAEKLADDLGIDYEIIEIGDIVQAIYNKRPMAGPDECRLAYANVKPRVRMIMNYFAANLESRIVLGTGNKTELLMGYFTKYGDGGVDILPIGDLIQDPGPPTGEARGRAGAHHQKAALGGALGRPDGRGGNGRYLRGDRLRAVWRLRPGYGPGRGGESRPRGRCHD